MTSRAARTTTRGATLRRAVFVLSLALACVGCMRTTVVDTAATAGKTVHPWANFFVLGTIGEHDEDARFLCEGPVARAQTYDDVLTLLISITSLGIYTPRRLEVVCAAPSTKAASR